MKIYADKTQYTIEDKELYEYLWYLVDLRNKNYGEFVLRHKELTHRIRSALHTNRVMTITPMKYGKVAVLTFGIIANEFSFYTTGRDENGIYIEIKEEK